ncbi:transposable element Tc3 transposase [Trichonephila clavipes]|nr:transposable element Tc3 transposase [Trichonephila clavipes]
MDWPARSPDLNPIEHVWDFLGRRLAARTLPPVTIRELRLALQDEWAAMPQQLIDTLLFIPLISLLVSVAYITHVLTYWGSYGIKCVDLESFCTKLY